MRMSTSKPADLRADETDTIETFFLFFVMVKKVMSFPPPGNFPRLSVAGGF